MPILLLLKELHYKIALALSMGTVCPICCPKHNQRVVYNGHKRVDNLKFQSVVVPNGMIANLYGPIGTYEYFM